MLLSGSRDKTLIIWNLTRDETNYGYPKRSLHGHSHIVSDCVSIYPTLLLLLSLHIPGFRPSREELQSNNRRLL